MGRDGLLLWSWDTITLFTHLHVSRKSRLVYLQVPSIFFSFYCSFIIHVSHISACFFDYFSHCMQAAITIWVSVLKGAVYQSDYSDIRIYFERKCQNRGNVIITTQTFLTLWPCLWTKCFCELTVHCACVSGAAPCTRPMWSAIRGACRLTIPFRWLTSAPRVPRWASLVAEHAVAIVTVKTGLPTPQPVTGHDPTAVLPVLYSYNPLPCVLDSSFLSLTSPDGSPLKFRMCPFSPNVPIRNFIQVLPMSLSYE